MKTLIYFASGPYKPVWSELPFDRIILVDKIFHYLKYSKVPVPSNVSLVPMDCLDFVKSLKSNPITIDCVVALNEGLFENGGTYAVNSDMFLGYLLPYLNDEYIHIMSRSYYTLEYNASMDLPYACKLLPPEDARWLDPAIFSDYSFIKESASNFLMSKNPLPSLRMQLNNTSLEFIHDSIWSSYDELDLLCLSFTEPGMADFLEKIPKVLLTKNKSITSILGYCQEQRIQTAGFIPFAQDNYASFIDLLQNSKHKFPETIKLFHLNNNDYSILRKSFS
jgi:hypothetical protein